MNFLLIALLFSSSTAYAQTLSEKEIRDFRGSISSECYSTQRATKINNSISNAQVKYYCECYAKELIPSNFNMSVLNNAIKAKQKSGNDAMFKVILNGRDLYAIGNYCGNQALQNAK